MDNFPRVKAFAATLMLVLTVSALALFYSPAAFAQATTGTLRGTVADPNGQVVVGVTVTIKNQETGSNAGSFTTTSEGTYAFPGLRPGLYTITVEPTAGFSRQVVTDVNVGIGQDTSVPIALSVGAATETVTVTGAGEELIQQDQSQISTTFETRRIQDLPSNGAGGGLDTLALLAPGVIANRGGGTNTNGTGLSVNGNRGRSNNFQIDGADNNDLAVAGPALFVDNQDQVQEYQVITNNFSAQYGRNQGAVVNIVTKGGTNRYQFSAFEFHQDNKNLNSLDNIEKRSGQLKPNPSLYNVFGGTVGGPLTLPRFGEGGKSTYSGKDRAFFFVSYQGIRNPSTSTLRSGSFSIVPSEFARLSAAFPNSPVIQTIVNYGPFAIQRGIVQPRTDLGSPRLLFVNPTTRATSPTAAAGFVGPFQIGGAFDVVNFGGQLFQAARAERILSTPYNQNEYSVRFDVKPTSKDNVTVRFLKQRSASINGLATSNGFTGDIPAFSTNFGGTYTRQISSTLVNEFRAAYQSIGVVFGGGETGVGAIPDALNIGSSFANITFGFSGGAGFTSRTGSLATIGPATNLPQGRTGKVYQLANNLTYIRGRQTFLFGGEFKHLTNLSPFLPNYNGAFAFNSATRVLNNAPSGVSITAGNPLLAFKENDKYFFVQDDFKVRPNLTLNLGLRYENTGQPINQLNEQAVARESNASTAFFNPALPLSIRVPPRIPVDKNNFAPRLGFAYTPKFFKRLFGEDQTVIRGGFSIAYDAAFFNILQNVQNTAPFSAAIALNTGNALASTTNGPVPLVSGAPTGDVVRAGAAASGALPLGKLNPLFLTQNQVARDFHSPYSEQFSLGIQHQFGKNQVAEVRYVGTHGVGLFQNVNGNFFIRPLLQGFTNSGITFPGFPQFVPAGVTSQVCVDNPATFDREDACNGRILQQGSLTVRTNTAQSIYHSMQARYNARLSNSLSAGAAYTFSKTIDNASEIFAFGDTLSANAQNPFDTTKGERSLSALDRPHAFSTNFIYDVPFFKSQKGFVGHLLGGFQVNGTYILTSGATFTPSQSFNAALGLGNTYLTTGDRPFVGNNSVDRRLVGINQVDAFLFFGIPITNSRGFYSLNQLNTTGDVVNVTPNDVRFIINGPGSAQVFGTPFGTAARNSLRGPKFNQANLGVFKNTRIGERFNVQIRAEAFNVLNHPNPGFGVTSAGYLPNIDVVNAGVAGSAFADNQDIELARRVIQFGIRLSF